ncbi:MAG: restriction endonuclease [Actinomycetota bacterium]
MTRSIELVEYETTTLRLAPDDARRLAEAGRGAISVGLAEEPGIYTIAAQNLVGTLVSEDLKVLIRPKIRPENVFLLLEVGLPPTAWRQEVFDYETSADLLPSVVAFFARTLETTLARGVLRSYRAEEDRLVTLRGRIDMTAQFRQAGIRLPVACRFDEYTPDNAENRYLKAAARLALRVPGVLAEDRRRLLQQVVALEDVSDEVARPDDLDRISTTRLNAHYEPALRLARLLLECLNLVDQRGEHTASSFLVDMNLLFEAFVTQRLRRELRGRLEVLDQFGTHLAEGRRVPIRPDLVFRCRGEAVYVADIKYKLTSDARARTADHYQLLAYTTALDLPEGVLIYCLAEGRPERSVTVRHAGKVLHTLAIDLTGRPAEVADAIAELGDWLTTRAAGVERSRGAGRLGVRGRVTPTS